MPDPAESVLSALAWANGSPLTLAKLVSLTGLDPRTVQATIQDIRTRGAAAICSGSEGYWLARSVEEYAVNLERRRRRAITQLVTNRGERRLLRRLRAEEAAELTLGLEVPA